MTLIILFKHIEKRSYILLSAGHHNLVLLVIIDMPHYPSEIEYSEKYYDEHYEYRHVILPKEVVRKIPSKGKLLSENEWRALGIQQSRGWEHYEVHKPEPHILLFRRPIGTDPYTGQPPPEFVPPAENYWWNQIFQHWLSVCLHKIELIH